MYKIMYMYYLACLWIITYIPNSIIYMFISTRNIILRIFKYFNIKKYPNIKYLYCFLGSFSYI